MKLMLPCVPPFWDLRLFSLTQSSPIGILQVMSRETSRAESVPDRETTLNPLVVDRVEEELRREIVRWQKASGAKLPQERFFIVVEQGPSVGWDA